MKMSLHNVWFAAVAAAACVGSGCAVAVPDISAFPDAADDADGATDDLAPADVDGSADLDAPRDVDVATKDTAAEVAGDADAGTTDADAAPDAGSCPVGCDDGVTCTTDSCDPASGCVHTPADGSCDDGNGCTTDSCTSASGCVHLANTSGCQDGNVCTVNDTCAAGSCVPGIALNCDDTNACTTDSCAPASGCGHLPLAATACDDGNACTTDTCVPATGCAHAPWAASACDDGKLCTIDSCVPASGCTHFAKTAVDCADADLCTSDSCVETIGCTHGSYTTAFCDDANPCTTDSCDATTGCTHVDVADGITCTSADICVIFAACESGSCAGSAKLWAKTFGGALSDSATSVAVLGSGNIAVGVNTRSKTAGGSDAWIFVRDAAGGPVWDRAFGGAGDDTVDGIADGGPSVVFVGKTASGTLGGSDAWYGLLNASSGAGTPVVIGGSGDDALHAVASYPGGGFIFAGDTASTNLGAQGVDGWLVRVDAAGIPLWKHAYDEAADEYLNGVSVDAAGIYATGRINANFNSDLWLLRTDLTGAKLWSRRIDVGSFDVGTAAMGQSDGVAVAGGTNGKGAGDSDFWLLRFDNNGNKLWDRTFGGGGLDYLQGAVMLADGYVLHGWNYGNSQTFRTDLNGTTLWSYSGNPTGVSSVGMAVAATSDGLVYAGHIESSGGFDSQDVLLVRGDNFGNVSCAISGTCLGKVASDCSDGNTCTLDLCDVAGGCHHTALPDATLCSDGDPCTMNEFCTTSTCGGGVATDIDGDGFKPVSCGGTDCNDFNAAIHPNAPDSCDDSTVDDNCDGVTDGPNCSCAGYYWPVISDHGHICAPDGPIWGSRPDNLDGLLTDNGDGTATDTQTKLQWQIVSQLGVTFDQATAACLASTLGGQSDWRLPTMAELATLFDASKTPVPVASVLAATTDTNAYWSCWGGNSYDKIVSYTNDSFGAGTGLNARCVRGGPPVNTAPRFVTTAETVYDNLTKLTWQRLPDLTTQYPWAAAAAVCAAVKQDGASWRLPTFGELLTLVSFGAGGAEFGTAFPNGVGNGTWSSTVPASNTAAAAYTAVYYGFTGFANATSTQLVLCVH